MGIYDNQSGGTVSLPNDKRRKNAGAEIPTIKSDVVLPSGKFQDVYRYEGYGYEQLVKVLPPGERDHDAHMEYAASEITELRRRITELCKDMEAAQGLVEKFL